MRIRKKFTARNGEIAVVSGVSEFWQWAGQHGVAAAVSRVAEPKNHLSPLGSGFRPLVDERPMNYVQRHEVHGKMTPLAGALARTNSGVIFPEATSTGKNEVAVRAGPHLADAGRALKPRIPADTLLPDAAGRP